MRILAIEKELQTIDWANEAMTLKEEAQAVYRLMLTDKLREIYFTENKQAVLLLECENKDEAKQLLSQLPLVIKGWIDFDLTELRPYTGFSRFMEKEE